MKQFKKQKKKSFIDKNASFVEESYDTKGRHFFCVALTAHVSSVILLGVCIIVCLVPEETQWRYVHCLAAAISVGTILARQRYSFAPQSSLKT